MAKKENSALEGTQIQIKRTELDITNTVDRETIVSDGVLKFGEPLYFDKEKYLSIGTASSTPTPDLKVFKAIRRDLAEGLVLYDQKSYNKDTKVPKSGKVALIDDLGNPIYQSLRIFSTIDSEGIPKDSTDTPIIAKHFDATTATWYKVKNGTIDLDHLAGESDFPKAQQIKVTGMTEDIIPFIGLIFSNKEADDKTKIKTIQTAYNNITGVESITDAIIIYCGYKNLNTDCYLNVFGG